ncbi:hypothetical protein FRB98_003191 [Tulasnella sp. 332]|nr:hypothetical protein FRB98_003191 [Tulasnella sp. 332]
MIPGPQQLRALTIPEVFLEILSNLSAKDLTSSARVCREWLTPAIDTKWRTKAIRLSHLLAMLAPLVEDDDASRGDFTWKLLLDFEEMTQERWTYFLENYSNKITWLEVDIPLDMDTLELLKKLLEWFGGRLGSGISILDATNLEAPRNQCMPLLDLLLGPKQLEVRFTKYIDSETVTTLVTTIGHRAPGVTNLEVASIHRSVDYSVFSRLRTVSHQGILSPSDYITLSNCQNLRILRFGERSYCLPTWPLTETAVPIFPLLHKLRIHFYSPQLEDQIFKSIIPLLHIVDFKSSRRQLNVPALHYFLRSCNLLEDLGMRVEVPSSELAKMGHGAVRRLHIENSEYMTRNSRDDEFNWIGASYPKLRELTLGCDFHSWKRSEWGILTSLGPKCDQLEMLTLPLHVSTFTLPSTLAIKAEVVDPFAQCVQTFAPSRLGSLTSVSSQKSRQTIRVFTNTSRVMTHLPQERAVKCNSQNSRRSEWRVDENIGTS